MVYRLDFDSVFAISWLLSEGYCIVLVIHVDVCFALGVFHEEVVVIIIIIDAIVQNIGKNEFIAFFVLSEISSGFVEHVGT